MDDFDRLRYPVGPLERVREPLSEAVRHEYISVLERTPARIRALLDGVTDAQLESRYRPGGWTVRQVVHHIADSHINAYVRMKLAATEDFPSAKTYDESRWAELPEARSGPIDVSLALLEALHTRLVAFVRGLSDAELRRAFKHPDWGDVSSEEAITIHAWHCRHHTEHIVIGLRNVRE
jgi:hypothetical protein